MMYKTLLLAVFSTTLAVSALAEATIRAGDTIQTRLTGVPSELAEDYRIETTVDDGMLSIPHISQRIKVTGLTSSQLAKVIEDRLKAEKIFTNPTMTVNVVQQRTVVVGGAVRGPGRQLWSPDMTLLGAISAAGGYNEFPKDEIRLFREENGGKTLKSFSRKRLARFPGEDPRLLPGDRIEVVGDL
jgi:protein involved in polysaccharide export with SLBB domain